ncbi:MAG: hypothetical protein PVI86_16315 [Phycisphaerae bacterium]|jgi:hypothetical protein
MNRTDAESQTDRSLISWLLIATALATLAPCILLPEWREYQATRVAEQAQQYRLDSLQVIVDRERRLHEAAQSDPAVLARLAQRDLRYRDPATRSVYVPVETLPEADPATFTPAPPRLPPPLARGAARLPALDYDAVFCNDGLRAVVMSMSLGLLAVGFWVAPVRRGVRR